MTNSHIHPTAIVESGATIGDNVVVEAYAIVKSTATLENGVTIKSHAYIDGFTTIGEGATIYPFASIGSKTQDLKFKGEKTFVRIGKRCQIREFVTINSSCQADTCVEIGDDCLIMAYCHVAHNCKVGNNVIMSNNATLAGHVIVEDYAIIGGLTPIHQFSRIGKYAMVGGMSRVTRDIPRYTLGGGIPYKFGGINLIGLKRHQIPIKTRQELSKAFKIVYRSKLPLEDALIKIEAELEPLAEIKEWVDFCRTSKRGLMGLCQEDELEQKEEEEAGAS